MVFIVPRRSSSSYALRAASIIWSMRPRNPEMSLLLSVVRNERYSDSLLAMVLPHASTLASEEKNASFATSSPWFTNPKPLFISVRASKLMVSFCVSASTKPPVPLLALPIFPSSALMSLSSFLLSPMRVFSWSSDAERALPKSPFFSSWVSRLYCARSST